MKNWNQLFIRQGFQVMETGNQTFSCKEETLLNLNFLLESLDKLDVDYSYVNGLLKINQSAVEEQKWLEALDFEWRGRGEGLWFKAGKEVPKVRCVYKWSYSAVKPPGITNKRKLRWTWEKNAFC